MLFGYSHKGERFRPSFSGQKAICPECGGTLVAKCGDIYVWHWAHSTAANCDSWKEHETDWHRNWKGKFPVEFQEVVIQKDGEKHIADVLTPSGTIIEFQNSSISTSTIQVRENFYEDMIWVINAESFKDHFKLRSVVKSELKIVDQNSSRQIKQVQKECDTEINSLNDNIQQISRELGINSHYSKTQKDELEKWQKIQGSPNNFIAALFQILTSKEERIEFDYSQIIYKIEQAKRTAYFNLIQNIHVTKSVIRNKGTQLQHIINLENYNYQNVDYKIVEFKQVSSSKYKRVIGITKSTLNTLFHNRITFKSEYEFVNYPRIKEDYVIAIDLLDELNELSKSIEKARLDLLELESQKAILEFDLKVEIDSILNNKCLEITSKIITIEEKCSMLSEQKISKAEEKDILLREHTIRVNQATRDINSITQKRRFETMKVFKGYYTFRWKHERKSWQYATNKIYFDIGENYLLEYFDEDSVQKISIKDFLERYSS